MINTSIIGGGLVWYSSVTSYQLARYFELGHDYLIRNNSKAVHFIHMQLEMYIQNLYRIDEFIWVWFTF
jgi:hypothetical protein